MKKTVIALLCGGKSAEREVSLKGGGQVAAALDPKKYEVRRYDPADGLGRLAAEAAEIDCALVILHGRLGEDGSVQGLLDLLDIPYQCSGVLGSALSMNKVCAKALYRQAGLPLAPDCVVERGCRGPAGAVIREVGVPCVVKPAQEGSSIGLSIARTRKELDRALTLAFEHDRQVLVEKYLPGREITGAVLEYEGGPRALPIVEIIPGEEYGFFDYKAKYIPGASREICPARIGAKLTGEAKRLALAAHKALMLSGYSRTDMIISGGRLFVLETNTIPGMTQTSLFPQAAAKAGLNFSALLDHFIAQAMRRKGQSKEKAAQPRRRARAAGAVTA
jgi:D-alanine-D-alanine ligase